MRFDGMYADKIEFCKNCEEFYFHPIDRGVCGVTEHPLVLMDECPMGDERPLQDLDPAYYWFDRPGMTTLFCRDCQFKHGTACHSYYGTFDIDKMARCVLPRLDKDGTTRQPRDVYPVLRN